jgi:uncharacterized protein
MRFVAAVSTLLLSFQFCFSQQPSLAENKHASATRVYSKNVQDSFSIYVKLPEEHTTEMNRRFTTIYLLDANLYFDVVAAMVEKYKEIGIMPPVILVGIGYSNFEEMEKLRTRDYLYPKAPGKEEPKNSGGGLAFLGFLQNELIPLVDKQYRTKPENRIVMGHSYGGYFCLLALLHNLQEQNNIIRSYIAASPSLQYNDEHLLQQLRQIHSDFTVPKLVYAALGGLEDEEDGKQRRPISIMYQAFNDEMKAKGFKNVIYQADSYSSFYHMETAVAGFMKGLLFIYRDHP